MPFADNATASNATSTCVLLAGTQIQPLWLIVVNIVVLWLLAWIWFLVKSVCKDSINALLGRQSKRPSDVVTNSCGDDGTSLADILLYNEYGEETDDDALFEE